MRAAVFLIAVSAAQAGVFSRNWDNGKLSLQLDNGVAELEWISGTSFRYARGATSLPVLPPIRHEAVSIEFEDARETLTMRGRYLSVEIEKSTAKLRVRANGELVSAFSVDRSAEGLTLQLPPISRSFGLAGPGDSQRFFFTAGYGIFVRGPRQCTFDLIHGVVQSPAASMDFLFYYGPTPKEIFEQHQLAAGRTEVTAESLHVLSPRNWPAAASPLPDTVLDTWEPLAHLVQTLHEWSLSAVLYPTLDLAALRFGRGDAGKRAADLAAMLPLLAGDTKNIRVATRDMWAPYLTTYLREAYDRGYPLIRPMPLEFSREPDLPVQPGVFMLGDEVLLAPVVSAVERRSVRFPRGTWTDLRTDAVYKGGQEAEFEAPPGWVPVFARNGALLPLAVKSVMELHYFPSLGGEFFLWEPDKKDNSQFHAAPAGDFTRVEIESLVARTYEWVIHHAGRPSKIEEFTPVRQRSALKPGTWWHDEMRGDLHVMLHVEAGSDRIVNISF